jgi:hypothetical protein
MKRRRPRARGAASGKSYGNGYIRFPASPRNLRHLGEILRPIVRKLTLARKPGFVPTPAHADEPGRMAET